MKRDLNRRSFLQTLLGAGATALFGGLACSHMPPLQAWVGRARLDETLRRYVESGTLPGVAGSIGVGTAPARFLTAGVIARESNVAVDSDSIFRIMSMSKPITGMAVMMLIEEGAIDLDQRLADFIPGFARARVLTDPARGMESRAARTPITIRHLLTHTSGLAYFSRIDGPLRDAYIRNGLLPVRTGGRSLPDVPSFSYAPNLTEFANRLAALPLVAEPGTRWVYSMSPDLLGRVIEVASGLSFETFLETRIFAPLGMTSTVFTVPESEAHRLTSLYSIREGRADVLVDAGPTSICLEPPPFPFGGSGLLSSPRDYDRFLRMLAGEGAIGDVRIMRRSTARLAMSNLLPPGVDMGEAIVSSEGFGALGSVALRRQRDGKGPGTYGWSGGAGTTAFVDPSRGLRVAGYAQYIPARELGFRDDVVKAVRDRV